MPIPSQTLGRDLLPYGPTTWNQATPKRRQSAEISADRKVFQDHLATPEGLAGLGESGENTRSEFVTRKRELKRTYLHVVSMWAFTSLIGRNHELWIRRKREECVRTAQGKRMFLKRSWMSLQRAVSKLVVA
jgi:hypothetical protein